MLFAIPLQPYAQCLAQCGTQYTFDDLIRQRSFHRPGVYDPGIPPGDSKLHLSAHFPGANLRISV